MFFILFFRNKKVYFLHHKKLISSSNLKKYMYSEKVDIVQKKAKKNILFLFLINT